MKWKHALIIIFVLSLIPLGVYLYFQNRYQQMVVIRNKNISVTPTITPTPDPNRDFFHTSFGVMLGANHDGGFLTDSIMLARVSPKLQKIDLISLPRDLWVVMPISTTATQSAKINFAYALGISDKKYPNKSVEYTGLAGGGEMSKYIVFYCYWHQT